MPLYTWLNLGILFFPFVLSFDRRVAFWRHWPTVAGAILAVGGGFVAWDVAVTKVGHWSFDPVRAGAFRLLGLPVGEILFFVAVPYACIFIYECVRAYFPEAAWRVPRPVFVVLAAASLGAAFLVRDRGYTFIVLTTSALTFVLLAGPAHGVFSRRSAWVGFAISYAPFLVFNGVFTALPIVSYDPGMILGPRVTTIPVEDFLYSFCLVTLSVAAHEGLKRLDPENRMRRPA